MDYVEWRKYQDVSVSLSTPLKTEQREFLNLNEYGSGDNEDDDGDGYDPDGNMGSFTYAIEQ